MLVSYQWLKEYVDICEISPQQLADKMSLTGIEIESVTCIGEQLKKIVVGYIKQVADHPDSDHLHICQVEVGLEHSETGVLEIVCGAPNVAVGQKVIVALVGARIKDNIKIKRGKIRGVVSNGMLCSLEELGIKSNVIPKKYSDGIYVLPSDAPVGADAIRYLQLDDTILELSITPNRADALSLYGVAYEVGAIYNQSVQQTTQFELPYYNADTKDLLTVTVQDSHDTPYYAMSVVKNVSIQESPLWLQLKLMAAGIRPINNVVDVTNYILLLYGQPLHAFDFDTLGDTKHIIVRRAKDDESLVTLDDVNRQLTADDVVITANDVPVALAGVMGGLDTEITDKTVNVALETAVFDSKNVRQTSKRFNLRSESSLRYEKGINLSVVELAKAHALYLIATLGNGQVVKNSVVVNHLQVSNEVVAITLDKISQSIGVRLSLSEVEQILTRLQFPFTYAQNQFEVTIPPRRWDIKIEADVIEEIARIYGYDNIPSTLPVTPSIQGGLSRSQKVKRKMRQVLQSVGLSQIIGYSLTSTEKVDLFDNETFDNIRLAMPMSEERSVLRRSLIPNLLEVAQYNSARHHQDLALYEMGKVFYQNGDAQPDEVEKVAMLLVGNKQHKSWYTQSERYTYFDLKGQLDKLFAVIGVEVSYERAELKNMHPGRTASILLNDAVIGFIGQVHPQLSSTYDLNDVYVAELNVDALIKADRDTLIQQVIPKFPSVTRDLALLVDDSISHQDIVRVIKANAGKYLNRVELFDFYKGVGIAPDKKSLAYRLTFLNVEATLVDSDVNSAVEQVVVALEQTYQAQMR